MIAISFFFSYCGKDEGVNGLDIGGNDDEGEGGCILIIDCA